MTKLLLLLLAACGRVNFDPRAAGDDAAPADVALDAGISGLIHYWPLDGSASDVVGNANGTVIAPATFVAGHRGTALASATGGYATVPIPADITGQAQLTINGWFLRATPTGFEQVGEEVSGAQNISIQLWNDGLLYFCVGAMNASACGTTPSSDVAWHMATLVFDGAQPTDATRLLGYLDGVAQTLTFANPIPVVTPAGAGGPFDLGAVSDNEGLDTGTVDEVTVFSRALSAAEIHELVAR
jgi:hypothetical protein